MAAPATSPQPPRAEARANPDERWLLLVGLLALLAFLGLGVVVGRAPASGLDVSIATWATGTFGSGPARTALDVLNILGTLEVGAALTIGLTIVLVIGRRPGASLAILSTWLTEIAGGAVKLLVMRERPPGVVVESVLGESWAYPSGHVMRAVAVVAVLAWLVHRGRAAASVESNTSRDAGSNRAWHALAAGLVAGVLMGIARLAAGVHWPTDVLGGLLLGTAFACWFAVVAERLERSPGSRVSEPAEVPPQQSPEPPP